MADEVGGGAMEDAEGEDEKWGGSKGVPGQYFAILLARWSEVGGNLVDPLA